MTEAVAFRVEGGHILSVRAPIALRKRSGRKAILAPDGTPAWAPPRSRVDNTMVKALARAFRWRRLLETGVYGTVGELAAAERINPSYVSRVLRLTLLAPEIVEAILNGRLPAERTLAAAMGPFPTGWGEQRRSFQFVALRPLA